MARNSYDDAFGVCRIRWQFGEPNKFAGLVLCEVWSASIVHGPTPTRTPVKVTAHVEVRFHDGDQWKRLRSKGSVADPTPGMVRRWAALPMRHWNTSLTLDGWNK